MPDQRKPAIAIADGYGITLTVHHGHLVLTDGIGRQRRTRQWPRIERDLHRILILGHTGTLSLDALRWCHERQISLSQLDADGRVVSVIACPGRDDARLRRAQAAAATSPVGVEIARTLIDAKIDGQANIARDRLSANVANAINATRTRLSETDSLGRVAELEAHAASLYFGAWIDADVHTRFAANDHDRVPEHWHSYAGRSSPIMRGRTASRAVDPINALLNYLYALAEIEARIALITLGLDPGIGIMHVDVKARDSLALDLQEVVRPHVDGYVLGLIGRRHFRARDFHETRDGQCRLAPPLAHQLADTMPQWAAIVAPHAEQLAHALSVGDARHVTASTPLTQANSRAAGRPVDSKSARRSRTAPPDAPRPRRTCRTCGEDLYGSARKLCPACWSVTRRDLLIQLNKSRAKPKEPKPSIEEISGGITTEQYFTVVLPGLAHVTLPEMERATGLSNGGCSRIKRGLQIPNPRHWQALAAVGAALATSQSDG